MPVHCSHNSKKKYMYTYGNRNGYLVEEDLAAGKSDIKENISIGYHLLGHPFPIPISHC